MPFVDWSTAPVEGIIVTPNADAVDNQTSCQEYGPVAVGDISEEFYDNTWEAYFNGSGVWYRNITTMSAEKLAFNTPNLDHLSMSWDQLANPCIAWSYGGTVSLWWYDPFLAAQVNTAIALGSKPFIYMDDRRRRLIEGDDSDVILAYQRSNSAFIRLQRDRFQVEYPTPIVDIAGLNLTNAGITDELRYQINYVYE